MEKYYSQTVGSAIITESGHQLARIYDVAFNTDTGKVVGFFTDHTGKNVVAPLDIIQWGAALIVRDDESISESNEIHQVMESLKRGIRIFKNRVVTKNGEDLGRVIDFAVNNKFFTLTKLLVAKSFLGLVYYKKRLIPATDIIEITKDKIIVKNPLKTEPIKAAAPAAATGA
jgi:sporulation protein YlmC with PRC-barrel domain